MKFILSSIFMLFWFQAILAQGVFSSASSGDWSAAASWTLDSGSDGDGIPDADDDITLLAGHTITLDASAACNNLTLEGNSGTRLLLGNNTLEINGTLTGLGTSTSTFPNYGDIISNGAGNGGLKFVGTTRPLFANWLAFSNQTQFELEVALNVGETGTYTRTIKAENILISSGTFQITGANLLIDQGSNDLGDLTISTGATLSCNHIYRSNNFTTYCNSILVEGTLETNTTSAYLNATTITINGTLQVDNTIVSNPTTSNFIYGSNSTLEYNQHSQPQAGAEVRRMASGNGSMVNNLILGSTISTYKLNGKDLFIANNLHFDDGILIGGDQSVNMSSGATITGYNNSQFIVSGNGTTPSNNPDAGLKQEVGATPVIFPIGATTGSYNPVTITNAGATDNFLARVDNSITTPVSANEVVNREWHIYEDVAGGSDLTLQFQFESSHTAVGFDINNGLHIGHCTGTGGSPPTSCAWDGTPANFAGSGTNGSPWLVEATGFTDLSPFGVGSNGALPVELIDFKGLVSHQENLLNWTTASEVNTAEFVIERSADGVQFSPIGFVAAAGTSYDTQRYSFTDQAVVSKLYYRLRILDIDGHEEFSPVIVLQRSKNNISVFPNPFDDFISVSLEENEKVYKVNIYNSAGQLVKYQEYAPADKLDVSMLQTGVYFLKISNTEGQIVHTQTIMKTGH